MKNEEFLFGAIPAIRYSPACLSTAQELPLLSGLWIEFQNNSQLSTLNSQFSTLNSQLLIQKKKNGIIKIFYSRKC